MAKTTTKEETAKKDLQSRSWFIVCPNVDKNGVCGVSAEDMAGLTEQEVCDYVVDQWATKTKQAACLYCVSAAGMKHLHVVLCGNSAIKFSTVKKFIGNKAHIEMTMGTKAQAEAYINKTGKFEEKGEVILAKAQVGEIHGRQGQRSDIEQIREAINDGLNWQEIVRLNDHFYDTRMTAMIKNMYFDKRKQETPLKRSVGVHWVFGGSGSGKTGTVFQLAEQYGEDNIFIVSDYQAPFDGYAGEKIIVMDEFRGQMSYSVLLDVTEGYKKQVHCRNANVWSLWSEVYITTIKTPEEVYAKMIDKEEASTDPIGQLLGRIKDISYCYKVNRLAGTKKDRDGEPAEFFRYTINGRDYRELKPGVYSKVEQMKCAAEFEYRTLHYQPGDTVDAFGIAP